MTKPIQLNGIKLSGSLAQVSQRYADNLPVDPVHPCRLLASERINISFLNATVLDMEKQIACLIDPKELDHLTDCIKAAESDQQFEHITDIGTLSLYPHKFSLKSLGHIIYAMGKENFLFHQMASSGSMLTFVVDFCDQEKIADCLTRYIELPVSHAPFRQEPDDDDMLMTLTNAPETSAAYVESKIKTYGIQARSNLTLCRLDFGVNRLAEWGKQIKALEEYGLKFYFASGFKTLKNRIRVILLVDVIEPDTRDKRESLILSAWPDEKTGSISIKSPVGLIGFQGPHFGDRYGIANQAFSALSDHSIPILVAGCVGASVNIVVPERLLQKATKTLSEIFASP